MGPQNIHPHPLPTARSKITLRSNFGTGGSLGLLGVKVAAATFPKDLGPEMAEMAALTLWAPWIFGSFCRKPLCPKNLVLGGGVVFFGGGGGVEATLLFLWRGDFPKDPSVLKTLPRSIP